MWYPKGNNLIIHAFTDADWAESVDDRENTHEALEYIHKKLGILPSSHYIFLFQNTKGGWKYITDLQEGCVSGGVEVCIGPQDGCVSGGVTLCH